MSFDVGEAMESLENELCYDYNYEFCSFSKLSVTSPMSKLIPQPFRRFTYVIAHSPTLPLLHLRHNLFSNPSFASPTSQALHLRHLASCPWSIRKLAKLQEYYCLSHEGATVNYSRVTCVYNEYEQWTCCCLPGRACDAQRLRRFQSVQAKAIGSQPGRPFSPGQSRLSCRSVAEGKMMEWGGTPGKCNRFPGICLTTEENPGRPQLGNCPGAHSSMTSHCFKWGHFSPNEVGRITLPAPLAKPIRIRPEELAKKIEIQDPKIPRSLECT